jgi:hypothetical protein
LVSHYSRALVDQALWTSQENTSPFFEQGAGTDTGVLGALYTALGCSQGTLKISGVPRPLGTKLMVMAVTSAILITHIVQKGSFRSFVYWVTPKLLQCPPGQVSGHLPFFNVHISHQLPRHPLPHFSQAGLRECPCFLLLYRGRLCLGTWFLFLCPLNFLPH